MPKTLGKSSQYGDFVSHQWCIQVMQHLNESFSQLSLDQDRFTVSSAIKQPFLVKPDIY